MRIKDKIESWIMNKVIKRYNYIYKTQEITSKWIARSTQQN